MILVFTASLLDVQHLNC